LYHKVNMFEVCHFLTMIGAKLNAPRPVPLPAKRVENSLKYSSMELLDRAAVGRALRARRHTRPCLFTHSRRAEDCPPYLVVHEIRASL
jgi:hypothetical protein